MKKKLPIFKLSWIEQFYPFFRKKYFIKGFFLYLPFINKNFGAFSGLKSSKKAEILSKIPKDYTGKIKIFKNSDKNLKLDIFSGFLFPIYLKPNDSERSVGVYKIKNQTEIIQKIQKHKNFKIWILQEEFLGIEYAINIIRNFETKKFEIEFLVEKEKDLESDTASIANGATFKDLSFIFSESRKKIFFLEEKINLILKDEYFKNFNVGRFDIKAENLEKLLAGEFKILELNGVSGMPLLYFEKDFYERIDKYFLKLNLLGKKIKKEYSIFSKIKITIKDLIQLLILLFCQKHFKEYIKNKFKKNI